MAVGSTVDYIYIYIIHDWKYIIRAHNPEEDIIDGNVIYFSCESTLRGREDGSDTHDMLII